MYSIWMCSFPYRLLTKMFQFAYAYIHTITANTEATLQGRIYGQYIVVSMALSLGITQQPKIVNCSLPPDLSLLLIVHCYRRVVTVQTTDNT